MVSLRGLSTKINLNISIKMVGTIETTHNNITKKFDVLEKIADIMNGISNFDAVSAGIFALQTKYVMGSILILSKYFKLIPTLADSRVAKNKYVNRYQNFIKTECIINNLDKIRRDITSFIKLSGPENICKPFYNQLKIFDNIVITKKMVIEKFDVCPECKITMIFSLIDGDLLCKKCGLNIVVKGSSLEDDYFEHSKKSYDPTKHCKTWVKQIQALEKTDIPPSVIKNIKRCRKRDKIKYKEEITCDLLRKYLSETDNTAYNNHVPLIKKIITKTAPRQLNEYNKQIIYIYFGKVIKIFNDIKPDDQINCPYHPYFIYKIVEQLKIMETKKHRPDIELIRTFIDFMKHIHLQSRETLINNDRTWLRICRYIQQFKYISTDRNSHIA
jgi:hypothetical protein